LQDERETHLAGHLLIELGRLSLKHLLSLATIGETVTLIQENNNLEDLYGRTLAYVFLSDGCCLNERMIADGYAKPYDKYYCAELPRFQQISWEAKVAKRGLFSLVKAF
jgi:micrococcal nuclease